jgi:hypothetical protein
MNDSLLSGGEDSTAELQRLEAEDHKALAKRKLESDLYIKTLETQKDELRRDYLKLREDYDARAKLEEYIDKLERLPQPNSSNEQPLVKDDKQPQVDIESLVSNKIQEFELTKKQTENFNTVRQKLEDQYGESYKNVLKRQSLELGLSDEDVNALARKSPKAFFKTMGLDALPEAETFQAPVRSNQRSVFTPKGETKKTWSYYQDLKTKDPKSYFDPKTQVEMHKSYEALGSAFEDGDFNAFG